MARIADRYDCATTSYGEIASPRDRAWHVDAGGSGLGTSGSGDVLAGAIVGLLARGADAAQAAVWATSPARAAPATGWPSAPREVGFLARELCDELPRVLATAG